MSQISINIPNLQPQQTVELELSANGKKYLMNYRVESFAWPPHMTDEERIEQLRVFISTYDKGWELVQIGPSGGGLVPVMFRKSD